MQIIEIQKEVQSTTPMPQLWFAPRIGYVAWYEMHGGWVPLFPDNSRLRLFETIDDVDTRVREVVSDVSDLKVHVMKVELV